jgi:glucan 1,3-beta-glucosidase
VRTGGAKGDGVTDDTSALNTILKNAAAAGQIVFFDAGTYKVTSTITIPPGSKVVGESYSVIKASGSFFSSIIAP